MKLGHLVVLGPFLGPFLGLPISPGTVTGHASAGDAGAADVEFLNREAGAFLDGVTEGGKKMN